MGSRVVPLVVGMPVYRRAWCLDRWFDSVAEQRLPRGTRFLFGLTPSDDGTERIISRRAPGAEVLYVEGLPSFGEDEKDDPRRYAVLAQIRNMLLRRVCSIGPAHYLSWDSDILLDPGAYEAMLDACQDAIGALIDMGGEVHPGHWSWMHLNEDDAFRDGRISLPSTEPFQVGVIMGAKLLTPRAYRNARYADHILGEDVGWAIQCEAMGVERWLCPAARGEHLYRVAQAAVEGV